MFSLFIHFSLFILFIWFLGHYTCVVKNENEWVEISDNDIKPFFNWNPIPFLAYICLYKKKEENDKAIKHTSLIGDKSDINHSSIKQSKDDYGDKSFINQSPIKKSNNDDYDFDNLGFDSEEEGNSLFQQKKVISQDLFKGNI